MSPARAEALIEALDEYLDAKAGAATATVPDDVPPSRRYTVYEFERLRKARELPSAH